eukprot:CAMPEP_0170561124 /NCGR_PEP_ID=MMETSP0211-20121228/52874_1 /TAXON_ID=311385 /ORGANISM="Pseudokeronopsis sp., Strain OXSARD2" /LENGTH=43 /DNA_ID= /DNA_START= /DNA_END= /DNA_ORIENTATION=
MSINSFQSTGMNSENNQRKVKIDLKNKKYSFILKKDQAVGQNL